MSGGAPFLDEPDLASACPRSVPLDSQRGVSTGAKRNPAAGFARARTSLRVRLAEKASRAPVQDELASARAPRSRRKAFGVGNKICFPRHPLENAA